MSKNKTPFLSFLVYILTAALTFFFIACGAKTPVAPIPKPIEAGPPRAAETPPPPVPVLRAATVTFITGIVSYKSNGIDREVLIGEDIPVGATLRTDADSTCELQFGSLATLRINQSSTVLLSEIALGVESRKATATLLMGKLAAKVAKLTSKDRCNVATKSTVCGVRGTEFLVSLSAEGLTKVAVREGSVGLLPPSFDPAALEARAVGKALSPLVEAVFTAMLEAAPRVNPDQETSVGAKELEKASAAWTEVSAVVEKTIDAAPLPPETAAPEATTVIPAMLEDPALKASLASLSTSSSIVAKATKAASAATALDLKTLGSLVIHDLPAAPTTTGTAPASQLSGAAVPLLIPVRVTCEPSNATISLDGRPLGRGSVSILEAKGTKLRFSASLEGYEEASLELEADSPAGEFRTIKLVPKAAPSSSAAPSTAPGVAKVPEPERWSISVFPAEALITTSTGAKAAGRASGTFPVNGSITYEAALDGYESATGSLGPVPGSVANAELVLAPRTVYARFAAASAKPVGSSASTEDGAVFLDAKGKLYRATAKRLLWQAVTGNALAENAVPVVANGIVYVAGDRNLSLVSLATGSTIATLPLDEATSAIFGRRPAIKGTELLLGAADGLRVLDAASGRQLRTIAIPDGSDMTPRLMESDILIVDRKGRIMRIGPGGESAWTIQSKAIQPVALSVSLGAGRAFFADRKGLVSAFDSTTGALIWAKPADDGGKAIFDDLVVAGDAVWTYSKGTVSALSAATGARLIPPIAGATAPPFQAAGYVWIPMKEGGLVARDPATGEARGALPAEGQITSRPTYAKGLFICPLSSGEVLVLNPAALK